MAFEFGQEENDCSTVPSSTAMADSAVVGDKSASEPGPSVQEVVANDVNEANQANHEPWNHWAGPQADGLYNPQLERAACGVGFIVSIEGIPSHKVRTKNTRLLIEIEEKPHRTS